MNAALVVEALPHPVIAMSLTTSYLGLTLRHPFILGASPLTADLDQARRAEDGGCAAVVMHSLFAEEIAAAGSRDPDARRMAQAFASTLGHFPDSTWAAPARYLEQVRRLKGAVAVPVIASLNGSQAGNWLTWAKLIEEAGADALELNVYRLSDDVHDTPAALEADLEAVVAAIKATVRIPVAIKLPPYFTAFGNLALRLEAAGADGFVLFNRFYQPDVDVETLSPLPNVHLSSSTELLLRLRWLEILSGQIKGSLAVTGGVQQVVDGIKAILAGAHAVQMVSAVLQQGPRRFREMEQGLRAWMGRHHFQSIADVRGSLGVRHRASTRDAERAGYAGVLRTWSGGAG